MSRPHTFVVDPGLRNLLSEVGVQISGVLRRAGLPADTFAQPTAWLTTTQYFGFWRSIGHEIDDPTVPICLGSSICTQEFNVPIFAALCSRDLNTGLRRLGRYKKLMCPMALRVVENEATTTLEIEWLDKAEAPPPILVAVDLVFFVQLARLATGAPIRPLAVTTPVPPEPEEAYTEFFGRRVEPGPRHLLTFSAEDGARPFVTADEAMWQFFEPELRQRLSELDRTAPFAERVRAALLELLPSGDATLQAVAQRLAVSSRTLQRRLQAEGSSFRRVLDATREELARYYLTHSHVSGAEIAFLLGYEDPNSFYRAFQGWTGETPEQARTTELPVA